MTPVSYKKSVTSGVIYFSYRLEDLEEWHKRGIEHGDNWGYLDRRDGNILTYRTFGTIEHPRKTPIEFSIIALPEEMVSDEGRLKEPVYDDKVGAKFIIFDVSDGQKIL